MLSSSPPEFSGTERYAVRRTIRSGSSGVVYEAWDRTRNMPVAIKVLRSRSRAAIYRLKQEFRSLEGLSHPNLVTLHELFTEQGHWCLVMEMVEGRDLLSWIRDAPEDASWDWNTLGTGDYQTGTVSLPPESPAAAAPPDMSRVLHAFVQLVLGVHALHGAGKLHRDIKPSNALVRPDGRLVLIDFGLVWDSEREASEQSRIEEVMGTAAFMPPEQASGTAPTPAADVYAMGVVLFQALTGRLPFEGRILEVLSRKQSEQAPRCRSLVPSTPEALDTLVSRMLDSVPDQRPSTREILVALGEDIPRTATSTAFVPRQRARQDLEELWAHARGGQMAVALVSGPQGIGRSTWIRHVLRDLRKYDQALVLRGACHERETVAFKALDGMVDSLRRRLERIPEDDREKLFPPEFAALQRAFPALLALGEADTEPLDPQALGAESERAYSALAELLTRLSRQRPMVVFLDDVHWGDLDSAMLLASLFRQATEAHILWLLSYREEDVSTSPFLVHLLHEPSVQTLVHRRLCLQPLEQSDGARLAESIVGPMAEDSPQLAFRIAEASGGNPFLLTEMANHVRELGERGITVTTRDDRWTLEEVYRSRAGDLPADARELGLMIAISVRRLPLAVLARAANIEGSAEPALDALRAARLVRVSASPLGDLASLQHEAAGEVFRQAVPPSALAQRHLALARAMEHSGWTDPEALYQHFLHGGDRPRAATMAASAARAAFDALACSRAAQLYGAALSLGGWSPEEHEALMVSMAEAQTWAGQGMQAARTYLECAERAGPDRATAYRQRAGEQMLLCGHVDEGLDLFRGVLQTLGMAFPGRPWELRAHIAWHRACLAVTGLRLGARSGERMDARHVQKLDAAWFLAIGLMLVEPLAGRYFHERHLRLALAAGDPERRSRALAMELIATGMTPSPRSRHQQDQVRRIIRLLHNEDKSPRSRGLLALGEGISAFVGGDWDASRRACRRAERTFVERCSSVHFELAAARLFTLKALAWRGELQRCIEERARHLADARASGNKLIATNLQLDVFALVLAAVGCDEQARNEVDAVLADWQRPGFDYPRMFAMHAQAWLHLYRGRYRDATNTLAANDADMARSGLLAMPLNAVHYHSLVGLSAVNAMARGDATLEGAVNRSVRSLIRSPLPLGAAHASAIEAAAHRVHDREVEAREALSRALKAYESLGMEMHAQATRMRLAESLPGHDGQRERQVALEWMHHAGVAEPDRLAAVLVPRPPD